MRVCLKSVAGIFLFRLLFLLFRQMHLLFQEKKCEVIFDWPFSNNDIIDCQIAGVRYLVHGLGDASVRNVTAFRTLHKLALVQVCGSSDTRNKFRKCGDIYYFYCCVVLLNVHLARSFYADSFCLNRLRFEKSAKPTDFSLCNPKVLLLVSVNKLNKFLICPCAQSKKFRFYKGSVFSEML